jgi:hypothetical protein
MEMLLIIVIKDIWNKIKLYIIITIIIIIRTK